MDHLRAASMFAVDLVYPKQCAGCGRRGSWLCPRCEREVDYFAAPWCESCGVPTRFPCKCHSQPASVGMIRSVGPFAGWLRGAVTACKYHSEWARAADLGSLLADVCATLLPFDALVPVPLHQSRLRQRGFNQSLYFARRVGERLGVPVQEHVQRVRRTVPQVHLAADERFFNLAGAMAIRPGCHVAGQTFVLVDDVITTGSTLSASAAALLRAGASSVNAATVCREL